MNELKNLGHNKESLELTYFSQEQVEYPNNPFYLIFDETLKTKQPLSNSVGMGGRMTWNGVHGIYKWSEDNNAEIEKGWIIKADTIKELAAKISVDAAGLEDTVTNYNGYCRSKPRRTMQPSWLLHASTRRAVRSTTLRLKRSIMKISQSRDSIPQASLVLSLASYIRAGAIYLKP